MNEIDPRILPCPFCAGQFIPTHPLMRAGARYRSVPKIEELTDKLGFRVCCYGCGVQTWNHLKYTEKDAIEAWNTRAIIPPVPELEGTFPVVLYFGNDEDREAFIKVVQYAKPGLLLKQL